MIFYNRYDPVNKRDIGPGSLNLYLLLLLDSHSSKTFPRKVVKESGPKITSKNFEKSITKPGKKGVKQFKNKQQGDKIPKNKLQQSNKFKRKRKFQLDSKSDGKC